MYLNLSANSIINTNINVVFDESIYLVTQDDSFGVGVHGQFNANISFPNYAKKVWISGNPTLFNYPIDIPESVTNLANCFELCYNFNQPINLSANVYNCAEMFARSYNFNQPVNFNTPDRNANYYRMFNSCNNFNQPVNMYDAYSPDITQMFINCSNLNSPVSLSDNCLNAYGLFYSCSNFNQPFTFPNNVVNCSQTFYNCFRFNQPINFPASVTHVGLVFSGCRNFNSQVNMLGSNVTNLYGAFASCWLFNQPFNIPYGVIDVSSMFAECTRFNQSVVIPNTVTTTRQMFANCNSREWYPSNMMWGDNRFDALKQPIYIYADSISAPYYAQQMFINCNSVGNVYITGVKNTTQFSQFMRNNGVNRCNIYGDPDSINFLRNTTMLTNSGKPTWTEDATNNCFYNTTVNIYMYNNWNGVIQ